MIKVALLSHSGYCAGAENMLLQLANILQQDERFFPIICCPQIENIEGVTEKCHELGITTVNIPPLPWYIYANYEKTYQFGKETLDTVRKLTDILREMNPAVVICNTLTSLVPVLAARNVGIPIITWVHGVLDAHFVPAEHDLERRLLFDRILLALSDRVICCSEWTGEYYRPYAEEKMDIITNWTSDPGNDVEWCVDSRFVCLNTFDENKGVQYLLQAAVILRNRGYDFTIDLYGTGGKEEQLRQFVKKNKLSNIVHFCGRTNNVDQVYRNCFCVINPSDIESFGLTLIEGMAYKRPVIGVACGGPSTIISDQHTGFLIPPRDATALAEKMAWLLEHSTQAIQMGEHGREDYEKYFSPEIAKHNFIRIINEVINQTPDESVKTVLIEDTLRHILSYEMDISEKYLKIESLRNDLPMIGDEQQLCFSGEIKRRRSYAVSCPMGTISSIAMLFACHDSKLPKGMLRVILKQKNIVLSEAEIDLKEIQSDQWCVIPLERVAIDTNRMIQVELLFSYESDSGFLGVYENSKKRSFVYKVFNKLHVPLKGKDTLIASFS